MWSSQPLQSHSGVISEAQVVSRQRDILKCVSPLPRFRVHPMPRPCSSTRCSIATRRRNWWYLRNSRSSCPDRARSIYLWGRPAATPNPAYPPRRRWTGWSGPRWRPVVCTIRAPGDLPALLRQKGPCQRPEPARLVLLSADLFAELEPLPGGYRVLWASDRHLLACDVLDERALDATGRALVR